MWTANTLSSCTDTQIGLSPAHMQLGRPTCSLVGNAALDLDIIL